MSFLGIIVVLALLGVIESANRASRYRSEAAELAIEFSSRAKFAAQAVGGVAYLIGSHALYFHPPQTPVQQLMAFIALAAWTFGVSFVLNKRVSLAGRCVIDVSWMARRRELPIRAPVRFDRAVFGEQLHLRASGLFLPGPWMDSGTQAAFEIRERFKAQVIARAASGGDSDYV
jgi:hypothetical protein